MALTPEDVVNKRFQSTKFREGYDQDEVDDFLDEIVVELRRLNQENDELKQRLVAADARIAELQRSGGVASAAEAAAPQPVAAAPAPAYSAPAPASAPAAQDAAAIETTNTNNLLQLARRLHEEHVREGIAEAQKREGTSIKHDIAVPVSRVAEFIARADAALYRAKADGRDRAVLGEPD